MLQAKPTPLLALGWFYISITFNIISFLIVSNSSFAQKHTSSQNVQLNKLIKTAPFKALCLRFPAELKNKITILIDGKAYPVSEDEHTSASSDELQSNLLVFDEAQTSVFISGNDTANQIELFLIDTPELQLQAKYQQADGGCDEPSMIMQNEWRAGLPDPQYERIPNQAHNLIIHHSATDNSITDYTNLVRSIYLYHTEVNGWSDIGYNYLVSPDGSIYAGRDPGPSLAQDAVLGAHFCASNTGTMGICVLGNFENQEITSQAKMALLKLLSWKTAKDTLNPVATFPHPLNNELGIIAGHRDGCSTACPGELLYETLPQTRSEVLEQLHSCGLFPGNQEKIIPKDKLVIFPNPLRSNTLNIISSGSPVHQINMMDKTGRIVNCFNENQLGNDSQKIQLNLTNLPDIYLLEIVTDKNRFKRKLLILQ